MHKLNLNLCAILHLIYGGIYDIIIPERGKENPTNQERKKTMTQEKILNFALVGVSIIIEREESIQEKHRKEKGNDNKITKALLEKYLKYFDEIIELIREEEQKREKSC